MLFMMYCLDKPDSLELRLANREAHLEYMTGEASRVRIAGPVFSHDGETMQGSLFIVEANTIDEVQELNRNDPYQIAGLFSDVTIRPFKKVIEN